LGWNEEDIVVTIAVVVALILGIVVSCAIIAPLALTAARLLEFHLCTRVEQSLSRKVQSQVLRKIIVVCLATNLPT
jgi:hypothetical protein